MPTPPRSSAAWNDWRGGAPSPPGGGGAARGTTKSPVVSRVSSTTPRAPAPTARRPPGVGVREKLAPHGGVCGCSGRTALSNEQWRRMGPSFCTGSLRTALARHLLSTRSERFTKGGRENDVHRSDGAAWIADGVAGCGAGVRRDRNRCECLARPARVLRFTSWRYDSEIGSRWPLRRPHLVGRRAKRHLGSRGGLIESETNGFQARSPLSASPTRPRASSMSSAVTFRWVTARNVVPFTGLTRTLRSSRALHNRPTSAPPNSTMLVSG